MKTKLFLALSCLLLLVNNGYAQPLGVEINLGEEMAKLYTKVANRSVWNDGSMIFTIGMANFPEFREAWDISDEQYQHIEAIRQDEVREYRASPAYLAINEERDLAMRDPLIRSADERTRMDKFLEFEEKLAIIKNEFDSESLDNLLTPEQKQKIQEYQLATMSHAVFFPVAALEALALTDEQREQIKIIKKEFEPEFEEILEDYVNGSYRELGKQYHALVELLGYDNKKYHAEVHDKLMAESPAYKRLYDRQTSQREVFRKQFLVKTLDVLTDEQWDRLQELVDEPLDYIKEIRRRTAEAEKDAVWTPSPDSWKPGDPIPEEYRQERNMRRSRFPREEN